MLKKEFKEVLKQTFFLIISMFFLMFIFYLKSVFMKHGFVFSEYFLIMYQLFIFFFSFFLGISLFSSEIRNNGVEYLLTFPYSRPKLLFYKIFPRVAALLILYFVYLSLRFINTTDPFLLTSISFNALYFSVFFISVSLSVLKDNFVANSLATMFLILLFIFAVNFVGYVVLSLYFKTDVGFGLALFTVDNSFIIKPFYIFILSTFLALPFLLSFIIAFKKFDVRSSGRYLKTFFKYFIPMFLAGMILSFFIINSSLGDYHYFDYYLTQNNKVIKNTYSGTYVYDGKNETEIPGFSAYYGWSYEDGMYVYSAINKRVKNNREWGVFRLNKDALKVDRIYSPERNVALVRKVYGYKDKIAVLEMPEKSTYFTKGERSIVFIDTNTLSIKKVRFPYRAFSFCGVTETEGNRLWIGYSIRKGGVAIFTVNEDGAYKKILWSEKHPVFVNDKLITYRDGYFVFGNVSGQGYEEIKKIKIDRGYYFPRYPGYFCGNLDRKYTQFIYGKKRNSLMGVNFIRIDLKTFDMKLLKYDYVKRGVLRILNAGDTILTRFTETDPVTVNGIFRFEGDNLIPVEVFKDENYKVWEHFYFQRNGMMIRKKRGVSFYSFPDFKELKFKKLD